MQEKVLRIYPSQNNRLQRVLALGRASMRYAQTRTRTPDRLETCDKKIVKVQCPYHRPQEF